MTDFLIACKDASFAYDGSTAVAGLDFDVCPGDYLCVAGRNGSGKSTLLKGLLGLIKPSKGQVLMGGGLKLSEIGYLPQQISTQRDFPASVNEVVLTGRLNRRGAGPFYSRRDREAADGNMDILGILDLRRDCYCELSGGQQRRVLIARALCAAEKVLMLDEPASGLDPSAARDLYARINVLNKDKGITVVMVSHDLCNAARNAGKVLHLENRQVFFGTVGDYMESGAGKEFTGGGQDG